MAAPWSLEFVGTELLDGCNASLRSSASEVLAGKAVIALLFASASCGACRRLIDALVPFCTALRTSGRAFVLIVCPTEFAERETLISSFPWYGLAPDVSVMEQAGLHGVESVPHLVFLDGATHVPLPVNAVEIVHTDPAGARFPWTGELAINPRNLRVPPCEVYCCRREDGGRYERFMDGERPLWRLVDSSGQVVHTYIQSDDGAMTGTLILALGMSECLRWPLGGGDCVQMTPSEIGWNETVLYQVERHSDYALPPAEQVDRFVATASAGRELVALRDATGAYELTSDGSCRIWEERGAGASTLTWWQRPCKGFRFIFQGYDTEQYMLIPIAGGTSQVAPIPEDRVTWIWSDYCVFRRA